MAGKERQGETPTPRTAHAATWRRPLPPRGTRSRPLLPRARAALWSVLLQRGRASVFHLEDELSAEALWPSGRPRGLGDTRCREGTHVARTRLRDRKLLF